MNGADAWALAPSELIWTRPPASAAAGAAPQPGQALALVALLRVRNESLILHDTLAHLASFADAIVAYDDDSTDATLEILKSHEKVAMVIENRQWLPGVDQRLLSETRHRGLLLQEARKRLAFDWCLCCDADERYIGPIRSFVTQTGPAQPDAVRIQLFDAYMTAGHDQPYAGQTPLLDFRPHFGPERRDILMLWRNTPEVQFKGLDAREPLVPGAVAVQFACQHYGKSLSYEHWESTCDYYVRHFPWNPYGEKWSARRGRALHDNSDFGRPLQRWGDDLFRNAVKIY